MLQEDSMQYKIEYRRLLILNRIHQKDILIPFSLFEMVAANEHCFRIAFS